MKYVVNIDAALVQHDDFVRAVESLRSDMVSERTQRVGDMNAAVARMDVMSAELNTLRAYLRGAGSTMPMVSTDAVIDAVIYAKEGNRIAAIKAVRNGSPGLSLREAKEFVYRLDLFPAIPYGETVRNPFE